MTDVAWFRRRHRDPPPLSPVGEQARQLEQLSVNLRQVAARIPRSLSLPPTPREGKP